MNAARRAVSALGLVAAALLASAASAQTTLIDRGAFRLSVAGREIGRDSFQIGRAGADGRVVAQGWVELEDRRLVTVLETSAAHTLLSYQATVSGGEAARYGATVSARRLYLTTVSPAGEQTREARYREGAVVLEQSVAHHYYFAGKLAREGAVLPVIVPRPLEQPGFDVGPTVSERVRVGGQEVDARRLSLSARGEERRVWLDAQGRVLRVEIPSTGFLAERLRPPG